MITRTSALMCCKQYSWGVPWPFCRVVEIRSPSQGTSSTNGLSSKVGVVPVISVGRVATFQGHCTLTRSGPTKIANFLTTQHG